MTLPNTIEARVKELSAELKVLGGFANDLINRWDGDIDGGDLQEIAVKHGLLKPTMMDVPCGEICACAEFYGEDEWPVECFRKTELLKKHDTHGNMAAEPIRKYGDKE